MEKQPKRILLDTSELYRQLNTELFKLRLLSVDLQVIVSNVFDAVCEKDHADEALKAIYQLTYQQMEPVLDDTETNNPAIYGFVYADLEVLFRIYRIVAWQISMYLDSWELYEDGDDGKRCNFRIVGWNPGNLMLLEEGTSFEVNPRAEFDCGIYPFHDILTETHEATTIEDVLNERCGDTSFDVRSYIHVAYPRLDANLVEYRPIETIEKARDNSNDLFLMAATRKWTKYEF